MKKKWKKIMAVWCAATMLMTMPGTSALADEMADEAIITVAEDPYPTVDVVDSLDEGDTDVEVPAEEVSDEEDVAIETESVEQENPEESVGIKTVTVGDGVTATFDENTGAVEFYSNNGELWRDWVDKSGIDWYRIKSIKVKSGTVYLPSDSSGQDAYFQVNKMFGGLGYLTELDLSGFNTSNVTNMERMFDNCRSLTHLDLSNFDTSNVTNMYFMFGGCSGLTALDLSSFDISNVTNMSLMFTGCSGLTTLDLSSFNTSNVRDMGAMFQGCSSLTNLDLSSFNTLNVTNMSDMFSYCSSLTNLDLNNILSHLITSNVTNMDSMFESCSSLTSPDLSDLDTSNVTYMGYMFYGCSSLTNLDLSSFNTSNVTDMGHMFRGCSSLTNLDLSSFNTSNVMSMDSMFNYCRSLTNLDLSSFNTPNVTDMGYMFHGCSSLTNLDLSSFNTSNVTNMKCMFYGCSSLTNLDLNSFDTSNVTNMDIMFCDCISLTNLDLSNFNTVNVIGMFKMFRGCSNLLNLDLSSFDTSNVTELRVDHGGWVDVYPAMYEAFYGCDNLQLLKTPKKQIQSGVNLPNTMYDSADASYIELPVLPKSIVLTKGHSIQKYSLTLSPTSYTYDGKAKKPSVTVKNGTTILTNNTDYTVAYSNNTNAGTAKVTVTGKGKYASAITKTFTIAKATSTLKFASTSLSKKTDDAAFTNTLTMTTDGAVTFKSSNTRVATVNSISGLVTIKGAGTAIITATASAGINYKAGSASYTLIVTATAPVGFSDVQDPSHPYYKAIYWAAEAGITKGYSDGTFGIDKACTRSEAVMFLWRMAGKPVPVDALSSPFKDVPKSHAHYKAILWAAQKGITRGYSDGTFGINKTCTRGQIMTFIWRFKGQPAPKAAAKSPFIDVPKNHAYFKAILWGSQNKITNGFSDGTFGINKDCTRGQIVTFLYRAK